MDCVILEDHLNAAVPPDGDPKNFAENRLHNTKRTNAEAVALPVEKRLSLVGNRLQPRPRHTALLNALQLNRLD